MEVLRLIITLGFFSIATTALVGKDGFVILESTNVSYKFINSKNTFSAIDIECRSFGASIWIPSSAKEVTDVLALFSNEKFENIWLGIFKIPEFMNELLDMNGKSDFYRDWGGDNDTTNNKWAVQMTPNGKYSIQSVIKQSSIICIKKEKKIHSSSHLYDYTYVHEYKASYKFYYYPIILQNSRFQCVLDGAEIWVPESGEEVRTIFDSVIPDQNNEVSIGIFHWTSGVYKSIDGRENFYSKWLSGFPSKGSDYRETIVFRNGSYKNIPFSNKLVCKKNIDKPESTQYHYNKQMNTFYKVHFNKKSFEDAGKACEIEQASLLMLNYMEDLNRVFETVNTNISSVWIGYRKLDSGQFISINGENAEIPVQSENEEGCELLENNSKLSIKSCEYESSFICQIKGDSLKFQHSSKNFKGYLFVPYPMKWNHARLFCNKRNSSLVTFDSINEPKIMTDLMDPETNVSFIGYFKMADSKRIASLKGFNMAAFEQLKWAKEPVLKSFCVGISKNGLLSALGCHKSQPFICKDAKPLENLIIINRDRDD